MARNSRYSVQFRRRREGKTNYHLRRRLIVSRKTRLVIRISNKHTNVQFVEAKIVGDKTHSYAHTHELKKHGWIYSTNNIPSAYLVGYLGGMKAKKAGITSAILDIGINAPIYGSRVFTTLKGVIDAGIDIPHSDKIFPSNERIRGEHIAAFAKHLKDDDDKYKKQFSKYIKDKKDPKKLPTTFDKTKENIGKI